MVASVRHNFVARFLRVARQDPLDALDRAWQRVSTIPSPRGSAAGSVIYSPSSDWQAELHDWNAWPWPCACGVPFAQEWRALLSDSQANLGGFHDADPVLAEAIWTAATHVRPAVAVETGVAHGVTSRFLLTALEQYGQGHLWSVDAPPPIAGFEAEVGAAVPAHLRHRWTYVRGTSRRRLPGLLRSLGRVDLFVHDSLHTKRNVLFELDHIWRRLAPRGVIVVDDIDFNDAVCSFAASHPDARVTIASHAKKAGAVAIITQAR